MVPTVAVALDESHAALAKASRHQALATEILGHGIVETVQPTRRFRLAANVLHLRGFGLHAKRKFKGRDATLEGVVRSHATEMTSGDFRQPV